MCPGAGAGQGGRQARDIWAFGVRALRDADRPAVVRRRDDLRHVGVGAQDRAQLGRAPAVGSAAPSSGCYAGVSTKIRNDDFRTSATRVCRLRTSSTGAPRDRAARDRRSPRSGDACGPAAIATLVGAAVAAALAWTALRPIAATCAQDGRLTFQFGGVEHRGQRSRHFVTPDGRESFTRATTGPSSSSVRSTRLRTGHAL